MLLEREREDVAAYARRLRPDGLAIGTSGNVSARRGGYVAITPSAVDYDELSAGLIPVVDLDGRPVDGMLAPSSELPLHLAVYGGTEAGAVVHTHSPRATALASVLEELPAVHYLIADLGGPVRVAPYATFGTVELARKVVRALAGRKAALLQNHGAVTIGSTIESAYGRGLLLESIAELYLYARAVGTPRVLSPDELDAAAARLATRERTRRLTEELAR